MSTDYFLYAPDQDIAAMIGSVGMSGVLPWPGDKHVVDFVRWAIDENVKGIQFLNESELEVLRDKLGYDDSGPWTLDLGLVAAGG